VLRTRTG